MTGVRATITFHGTPTHPLPPMTPRLWLILALAVVGVLLGWWFVRYERAIGARAVLLARADSTHHADSARADSMAAVAASARVEADRLRQAARVEVARDKAVAAAQDSIIHASEEIRNHAEAMAKDSAVTVAALREEIARVVADSRNLSAISASERAQHERTVAALLRSIAADSTAIQQGLSALNAAVARAAASEQQVKVLRASLPSRAGKLATWAVAGAAGYILARAVR